MIFFYTFFGLGVLAASNVLASRNPVYSLLSLLVFFLVGSLQLLYLGVDFLAFVFIIVYVGALAVLFLFVVIILNIKASSSKFNKEVPSILAFSFLVLFLVTYDLDSSYQTEHIEATREIIYESNILVDWSQIIDRITPIKALGYALYTRFQIHFVVCGLILIVAIIGAIVLTSKSRLRKSAASQKISKQHRRSPSIGKFRRGSSFSNSNS